MYNSYLIMIMRSSNCLDIYKVLIFFKKSICFLKEIYSNILLDYNLRYVTSTPSLFMLLTSCGV